MDISGKSYRSEGGDAYGSSHRPPRRTERMSLGKDVLSWHFGLLPRGSFVPRRWSVGALLARLG